MRFYYSYKTVFLIVLIILAVLLGGFLYVRSIDDADSPRGTIYLSLVPNDFSSQQGMYSFDISSKKLKPFFIDSETPAHNFNGSFSTDGEKIAYMSVDVGGKYAQLYIMDKDKKNQTQVTQSNYHKKDPQWSPDGKYIAYTVNKDIVGTEDDNITDNWEVYISDMRGNGRFIFKGTNPMFSKDGKKLLIMNNDGLRLVDIDTGANKLVWSMEGGPTYTSMKLRLSDDKELLAWAVPSDGEILIINIKSWEPFEGFIVDRIQSSSFWPTFSPDGNYIAAQEVDWGSNNNQRLIIYNLNTKEKTTVLDLTDYFQEAMFVNDWR